MTQEIQHSFRVEAKPAEVWLFLWDLEAVTRCIPGSEPVTVPDPGRSWRRRRRGFGPRASRRTMDIGSLAAMISAQKPQPGFR